MTDKTPPPTVWPTLRANDARALIRFLVDVVGFEETAVYGEGDVVHHAELSWPLGGGIMLGSARDDGGGRGRPPPGACSAYIVVDEPDALYDRVRAAGARSPSTCTTPTTARGASGSATPRATAGTSAPTGAHPARPDPHRLRRGGALVAEVAASARRPRALRGRRGRLTRGRTPGAGGRPGRRTSRAPPRSIARPGARRPATRLRAPSPRRPHRRGPGPVAGTGRT